MVTRIDKRQLKNPFLIGPESSSANHIPMFELDNNFSMIDSGISALDLTVGPAASSIGNLVIFDSEDGKTLSDSSLYFNDICLRSEISSEPGNVPAYTSSDGRYFGDSGKVAANIVENPTSSIPQNVPVFNDATGKILADSGIGMDSIVLGPTSSIAGRLVVFDSTDGSLIADGGATIADFANTIHNHDANEITSGTLSSDRGVVSGSTSLSFLKYNGTTAATGMLYGGTTNPSATTRLNYNGYLYATRVYNAVYNDYADCFDLANYLSTEEMFGKIMALNKDGKAELADIESDVILGIASDMYAFLAGGSHEEIQENKKIPISVAGFVTVKIDINYQDVACRGNFVVPYNNGYGKPIPKEMANEYVGKIVGEIVRIDELECLVKVMNR